MKAPTLLISCFIFCYAACAADAPQMSPEERSRVWREWGQRMVDGMKKRSAEGEFAAGVKSGKLSFYATGSFMDGYSLPGLTQEEVGEVEKNKWAIVNMFPTDPIPLGGTTEYWNEVQRFASEYNRLVYRHMTKKTETNQSLEPARMNDSSAIEHTCLRVAQL